jgi:hypothetical protein
LLNEGEENIKEDPEVVFHYFELNLYSGAMDLVDCFGDYFELLVPL